jgi:hypothetical protein
MSFSSQKIAGRHGHLNSIFTASRMPGTRQIETFLAPNAFSLPQIGTFWVIAMWNRFTPRPEGPHIGMFPPTSTTTAMPDIKINLAAQVTGGPSVAYARTLSPEGFALSTIKIPGGTTAAAPIQVKLASDKLDLLAITSSRYSDKIIVETGTGGALRQIKLTGPCVLTIGADVLLSGHNGLVKLSNTGATPAEDADITILSAGDVTP